MCTPATAKAAHGVGGGGHPAFAMSGCKTGISRGIGSRLCICSCGSRLFHCGCTAATCLLRLYPPGPAGTLSKHGERSSLPCSRSIAILKLKECTRIRGILPRRENICRKKQLSTPLIPGPLDGPNVGRSLRIPLGLGALQRDPRHQGGQYGCLLPTRPEFESRFRARITFRPIASARTCPSERETHRLPGVTLCTVSPRRFL